MSSRRLFKLDLLDAVLESIPPREHATDGERMALLWDRLGIIADLLDAASLAAMRGMSANAILEAMRADRGAEDVALEHEHSRQAVNEVRKRNDFASAGGMRVGVDLARPGSRDHTAMVIIDDPIKPGYSPVDGARAAAWFEQALAPKPGRRFGGTIVVNGARPFDANDPIKAMLDQIIRDAAK